MTENLKENLINRMESFRERDNARVLSQNSLRLSGKSRLESEARVQKSFEQAVEKGMRY